MNSTVSDVCVQGSQMVLRLEMDAYGLTVGSTVSDGCVKGYLWYLRLAMGSYRDISGIDS